MPRGQHAKQLPRAPERVLTSKLTQLLRTCRRNAMRAVMRGATPILKPASSLFRVPLEPLVADPAADAVPGAELGHREAVAQRILNELQAFVHRGSLQPGHGAPRNRERGRAV